MSKLLSVVLILVAFGAVLAFQNCGGGVQNNGASAGGGVSTANPMVVNGTVQKLNVDGCGYVICSQDNANGGKAQCFIPQGIDPTLLNDGNVLTVNGYINADVLTSCMAGSVLQVTSATLVSGTPAPQ